MGVAKKTGTGTVFIPGFPLLGLGGNLLSRVWWWGFDRSLS